MLTIVFYATDGTAAKAKARHICATKPNEARVYDVAVWEGTRDRCDRIEVMDDVPKWQLARILRAYDMHVEGDDLVPNFMPEEPIASTEATAEIASTEATTSEEKFVDPVRAVHRGYGKWFVEQGQVEISGPHTKAEAHALVSHLAGAQQIERAV